MDLQSGLAAALSLNQSLFVDKALEGLTDEDLVKRPSHQTNPIGWILWHQFRVEDAILSRISGKNQVWIEAGWHEKFGMEADPSQVGGGDSLERVAAFKPSLAPLKGYAAAVREQTLRTLPSLTDEDLAREHPGPRGTPRQAAEMLSILMIDHLHHSGQICYLRGYITPGWSPI